MTVKKKIAQKRLTLLQLAERLRNVSEACRHHGISRSQFYEYKRSFQEYGFEGLMDRAPIPKSCPHETPPELREKILALSLDHPVWGPVRICDHLRLGGLSVSPSTVCTFGSRRRWRHATGGSSGLKKRRTVRISI